ATCDTVQLTYSDLVSLEMTLSRSQNLRCWVYDDLTPEGRNMVAKVALSDKLRSPSKKGRAPGAAAKNAPKNGAGPVQHDALSKSQILKALRALARGEAVVPLPEDLAGVDAQIAGVIQQLATNQQNFEDDLADLRQLVGREGRTMRRLAQNGTKTSWSRCAASINDLLDDLTTHTDEMARVISAVSRGDLSQRM